MRVCVEFDPLTDPLTAGHGRNRETRTDRDRPVSFPLRPSASTRFTLPTVRNQQVSGSSPLAGSKKHQQIRFLFDFLLTPVPTEGRFEFQLLAFAASY